MKKTKEGVNLKKKKFLRLKNTGSILVLMGLLIILVIALYTFILQSSYTKTALDTEIARDTASADTLKTIHVWKRNWSRNKMTDKCRSIRKIASLVRKI